MQAVTTCPVCAETFETVSSLVAHLQAEHRVFKAGKALVVGLDVAVCLKCGCLRRDQLEKHLQEKHGLSAAEYLAEFPHAIVQRFRASSLGGGRAAAGARKQLLREGVRKRGSCPDCDLLPDDLDYHRRAKHKVDEDYDPLYTGPNVEQVREILALRRDEDRFWSWGDNIQRVYFVQAGSPDRPVKIGFTQRPLYRLRALKTALPDRVVVLLTTLGTKDSEADLHLRFEHLRLRGEWFRPDPELLDYIQAEALKPVPVVEVVDPFLRMFDGLPMEGDEVFSP